MTLRGALAGALFAGTLSGCAAMETLFQDPSEIQEYRLVGAYDASSLRALEQLLPEDARPKPYEYIWRPHPSMVKACGPTKAPDGLGIFEAEAISNRQLPTLAIVVERMRQDVPPLDRARVRMALGDGQPEMFLEPAVLPRYLQVAIEGDVATRYKQQVKTQLQTYLCMEHKTGRGWTGGSGDQVRQALLLNPPDDFRLPDRKYFGGQNEPVPALLGPPQTCLKRIPDLDFAISSGGQGDTSLALVPSDVWGASLTRCEDNIRPGGAYIGPRPLTMALSETRAGDGSPVPRTWSQMRLVLRAEGELPEQQFVRVEYEGTEFVSEATDGVGLVLPEQPLFERSESGELGLVDLVSKVPYRYPTIGDQLDPERYTVLLVPNWQLVEGVRRLHAGDFDKPRGSAGVGVQDGVGWILDHPQHLFVMVPQRTEDFDHLEPGKAITWVNVARAMSSGPRFVRQVVDLLGADVNTSWGYTAGMLSGRAPITLPGPERPSWEQVLLAQRSLQHGLFLGASALLMLVAFTGVARLRDLWTRVPEERVEFWPGPPVEEAGEESDDVGELAAGKEGE